jgi:hypothetical protein
MQYFNENWEIVAKQTRVTQVSTSEWDGYYSWYEIYENIFWDEVLYTVVSSYSDYEWGWDSVLYTSSKPIIDVIVLSNEYRKEEIQIVFLDENILPINIKFE